MGTSETLPAFAIPRSRMSLVVGALGLIACLGFAFLIGLFGILPFFEAEFAHVSYPARFAALAVAAAIGVLGVWILRRSVGASRGEVRVDGDSLVIEHPDIFKAPLAIPREAIRVAVVDKQGEGRLGEEERISKLGDEQLGWAALPFLSSHESLDAPNVGLLFREPVAGPAVRHARLHGPLPGEALAGVRLRVEDPAGFERALLPRRCVREPNQADAAHADRLLGDWDSRDPSSARRPLWLDRVARNSWLMVPAGLVFPWLLVLSVSGALLLIYHRRPAGLLLLLASAAAGYLAFLIR